MNFIKQCEEEFDKEWDFDKLRQFFADNGINFGPMNGYEKASLCILMKKFLIFELNKLALERRKNERL